MRDEPHPIDQYVGARVRLRRVELQMSQEELGQVIGVSFQQVQKYEKGGNRISASRLEKIATALQVPMSFFFEDLPDKNADINKTPSPDFFAVMSAAEGLALIKALMRIRNRKIQRCIAELVDYMADNNSTSDE